MTLKLDKRYGCFTIKNEASFADTANKLGKIFLVEFALDDSGKYEEIPAYCASSELYHFVLFGFPEPEFDLRDEDERDNSEYILDVEQINGSQLNREIVVRQINQTGLLKSDIAK